MVSLNSFRQLGLNYRAFSMARTDLLTHFRNGRAVFLFNSILTGPASVLMTGYTNTTYIGNDPNMGRRDWPILWIGSGYVADLPADCRAPFAQAVLGEEMGDSSFNLSE